MTDQPDVTLIVRRLRDDVAALQQDVVALRSNTQWIEATVIRAVERIDSLAGAYRIIADVCHGLNSERR